MAEMPVNLEASPLPYTGPGKENEPKAAYPTLVIEPGGRWPRVDVGELWAYRGLFFFLVSITIINNNNDNSSRSSSIVVFGGTSDQDMDVGMWCERWRCASVRLD